MRKLLIPFICLIFLFCSGMIVVRNFPSGGGTSCGTFSSGDLLNETFDSTGYDNTWTENISGGTVDEDENTTPGSSECGFDGEWLEIEIPTGTYSRAHTYTDLSTSHSAIYVRFIFYLESESLADGDSYYIFVPRSTDSVGDASNAAIKLAKTSGNLELQLWSGYASRDTYTISTGTTYCVEAYWDNSSNNWEWKIDGISQGSGTNNPETDFQRIKLGQYGDNATNIPIHYYIDHVDVSSTGWLGCDQ